MGTFIIKHVQKNCKKFLKTFLILGLFLMCFTAYSVVYAAFNPQINYQGKLTDASGNPVANGTYNIEFKLYTVSSGGSPIWTETRTGGDKVTITNGLFSVMLGSVNSISGIDFNQPLYLGVNIGGTGSPSYDGEMTPRKTFGTVPASFVAQTLEGYRAIQFLRSDVINSTSTGATFLKLEQAGAGAIAEFIGNTSSTILGIYSAGGGAVGIGTTTPTEKLTIANGNLLLQGEYGVKWTGGSQLYEQTVAGAGVDRMIYRPNGDRFDVIDEAGSTFMASFNVSNIQLFTAGVSRLFIDSSGNLGIGTTTQTEKLTIAGNINLTGAFKSNGNAGTLGQVLQTTGTGVQWVATSTLGISGGSLSGGTNGYLSRWTSSSTLSTGLFLDNGTVAGINATSSSYTFNVKGSGALGAFNVASSTGTSLLNVRANGYVGIGTNAAAYQLDVKADTSGITNVLNLSSSMTGAGDGTGILFSSSEGSLHARIRTSAYTGTTAGLIFEVTPSTDTLTEALRITDTGNVGIGTTTPSAKLDVWGNLKVGTSSTPILFANTATGKVGIGTVSPAHTLDLGGVSPTLNVGLYGGGGAATIRMLGEALFSFSGGTVGSTIAIGSADTSVDFDLAFHAGGSNRMYIDGATGNVGIGTTTSVELLTIAGNLNLTGALKSNGNAGTLGQILQTTGTGVQWVATSSLGISGGGGSGTVNSGLLGQVAFYSANGTAVSGTSTLFITGEKIGVGTTTVTEKLVVDGNALITGLLKGGTSANINLNGLSNNGVDFNYLNGGIFRTAETSIAGTNDIFFQGVPATTAGYTYLEAWQSAGLILGTGNSTAIIFKPNRTEYMRLTGTGDLGIGTSTPIAKLAVTGTGTTTGKAFVVANSNNTPIFTMLDNGNIGNGVGADPVSWDFHIQRTGNLYATLQSSTGHSTLRLVSATGLSPTLHFGDGSSNRWDVVSNGSNSGNLEFNSYSVGNVMSLGLTTGLVGIGTSTPSAKLDVWGNLKVGTSSTPTLFVNTATGKVGIGSSTPVSKLSVVASSGVAVTFENTATWSGSEFALDVKGYSNLSGLRINAADGINALYNGANTTLGFTNNQGYPITFSSWNGTVTELMRIDTTSGKIGIGTSTATEILSVAGNINLTGSFKSNGNAGTLGQVLQTTGTGVQWVATSSLGITGGGISGTVNSGLLGQVAFYDANGTVVSGTSTLFITGEKLGIGTTTPGYKLTVDGDVWLGTTTLANGNLVIGKDGSVASRGMLHSIFLGKDSGTSTAATGNSNFFGNGAGQYATNADNSNFFGSGAGESATEAAGSNFFGAVAGSGATYAAGSNFFGAGAGFSATEAAYSNFFGENTGSFATYADNSNFFGAAAGNNATNASSSNFFGAAAGDSATNAFNSNFFGRLAGAGAANAANSNFVGYNAGNNSTNAALSNFIGYNAGNDATNASSSNFIGFLAGMQATNASSSNIFGSYAGYQSTNAAYSNFIGYGAGQYATNARNSNFLGLGAGGGAAGAYDSNFFGVNAGSNTNAFRSNFMGYEAGSTATNATYSNFTGYYAGYGATNANDSNFIGRNAGYNATNASTTNFIGYNAGQNATNANLSNYIGYYAGNGATNASNVNALGAYAGQNATNASNSFFVGYQAGNNATNANMVTAIGYLAGSGASDAIFSNFFGYGAGQNATNTSNSNFFGASAGSGASQVSNSNFFGVSAGSAAVGASASNFFGSGAGQNATNAVSSNFFGFSTGSGATNAIFSNFFGQYAGQNATNASYSNFFGFNSGYGATTAQNSTFMGPQAGYQAANANNAIFLGQNSGYNDTVNNSTNWKSSILIGDYTSTGGFSNSIAIGQGTKNSATEQLNLGGLIYGLGIRATTTPTATPVSGGLVGIGTSTPGTILTIVADASVDSGLSVIGNNNGFFEGNIQNLSSGVNASSDWVATANNGDDTIHYIDMGINGSGGGAAPFTGANQAYLYSVSDTLNIGALGTGNTVNFYTTGGTSPVERMRIDSFGNIGIGTTTVPASLSLASATTTGDAISVHGPLGTKLFSVKLIAQNFGGLVESGAFMGNNSFFAEEFNVDTALISADSAAIGDNGGMYFDTTSVTSTYSATDFIGGYGRLVASTTTGVGGLIGFGNAQNNLSLMFSKANLPVVQMKVRTNINNTTNDTFWGLMDQATAPTANDTAPANGIYFWNNNAAGGWQGVVRSGGANVGTVTCPGAISTTQFAIGRIQVESTSTVRFLIDNDITTDGVNMVDCGTVTGANPSAALGIALYNIHTENTATARNIDIDYMRVWQDDASTSSDESLAGDVSSTPEKLTQFLDNGYLVDGLELMGRIQSEDQKNVLEIITDKVKKNMEIVSEFVALRVVAMRGYFEEVFTKKIHTEKMCLKKSDGSEYCVNGDELQSIMEGKGVVVSPTTNQPENVAPTSTSTSDSVSGGAATNTANEDPDSSSPTVQETEQLPPPSETVQEPAFEPEPAPASTPEPTPTSTPEAAPAPTE
ncbi:MAG: hypothetical protein V4686_00100 [Patescibacteria group bacterium]